MEQYLIPIGLLLNSALMVVNRFFKELPHWLYLSGLILGCVLIIIGCAMKFRGS